MDSPGKACLPQWAYWCVMLVFGVATTWMIVANDEPGVSRVDLLVFAAGVGCILCSLAWFFLVALQRSVPWALILLVPVLNTLALPIFVRHYWGEGTRVPALLALVGIVGETVGAVRLLLGTSPSLV